VTIVPKNGWIHIKIQEKEEKESLVMLPAGYTTSVNPYSVVEVLSAGKYAQGVELIVPTHVLNNVHLGDEIYCFIEERFVMAQITL
jgi:hypothetical protein